MKMVKSRIGLETFPEDALSATSVPSACLSLQRSYCPGKHRLHRRGCGADRGRDGEGVQRQRLPPHAQELQPLLLSTVGGGLKTNTPFHCTLL